MDKKSLIQINESKEISIIVVFPNSWETSWRSKSKKPAMYMVLHSIKHLSYKSTQQLLSRQISMTGYTFVEVDVEIDQRRQRQRRTQNPVKHQGWNFLRKLLTKESILSSEYVPASQKLASLIISWTVITKFRRYRWKHDRNVLSRKVLIHNLENCHRITRVQQVAMVSGSCNRINQWERGF